MISTHRAPSRRNILLGAGAALAAPAAPDTAPPNPTLETIHSLRTIHGNFLDKPIPEPALDRILQASLRAANASNMQSYSIVVVKDRRRMKDLCGYAGSCLLLYCADYNRLRATADALGDPYFPDNVVSFVTASTNAAIAAQTAVIAARALGVDSLLTNGIHRGDMERVWRLLDLPPAYCFPLIALVLGYPTQEPAHRMGRLDGPGVIHQEKYHRLSSEEAADIIRKTDDPATRLALNDEWKKQGHRHYLDWFFKAWSSYSAKPTDRETQMFQLLKRAGFIDLQKP